MVSQQSFSPKHVEYMREALHLVPGLQVLSLSALRLKSQAEQALEIDETPVGCVLVANGSIIGRGINDTNSSLNVRTKAIMEESPLDSIELISAVRVLVMPNFWQSTRF